MEYWVQSKDSTGLMAGKDFLKRIPERFRRLGFRGFSQKVMHGSSERRHELQSKKPLD